MLRAEIDLRNEGDSSEDSDAGSGGQHSPKQELLRGKRMILNESEEHAARFSKWLSQIKDVKTRLTLAIESSSAKIAREEESATSDRSVALLHNQIKSLNEEALR